MYRYLRKVRRYVLEVAVVVFTPVGCFQTKLYPIETGVRIGVVTVRRVEQATVTHVPQPRAVTEEGFEEEFIPMKAAILKQKTDGTLYFLFLAQCQGKGAVATGGGLKVTVVHARCGDVEAVTGVRRSLAEYAGKRYVIYRMDGQG